MVKEEKIKAVEDLKKDFTSYKVVGVIDLFKMPSKQMQEIKKKIGEKAAMKVIKKSILLHAMEGSKDLKVLEEKLPTQPAILFTNEDPFKIYGAIAKLKSDTYAKDGDVAEDEIAVSAGPTSLMPGPVISEFAKVKIPAGVEGGKIAIKKDTVVAKKGDAISKDLSGILRKLNIKPIKIGMNVVCLFDGRQLYMKDSLGLVGEGYLNKMREAFSHALSLSVAVGYPTKENIGHLLAKAESQAKFLQNKLLGGS